VEVCELQLFKYVQFAIGYVFIASGIAKLLIPSFIDFFDGLGFPFPSISLFLLAIIEMICGTLMIANMYVRQAAVTLIFIMIGALVIAKLPIFFNEGLVSFIFEFRLDITMLILLLLLLRNHKAPENEQVST